MQKKDNKTIRERVLTLLKNQKEEERLNKSLSIKDKLFSKQEFQNASTIVFYASFDGEVFTFDMIKQAINMGKKIGLPVIDQEQEKIVPIQITNMDQDLCEGPFGIKQPEINHAKEIQPEEIDMVVVPAVAFDRNNNRLGRGGGYYDRFLEKLPQKASTVGLAFDFQVLEDVLPNEAHDIPVTDVVIG